MTVVDEGQEPIEMAPRIDVRGEALRLSLEYCAQVARTKARNFYYGMKLTPEPKRSAMYALYAFMRTCDDLADDAPTDAGASETQKRLDNIEQFRGRMQDVLDGKPLPAKAAGRSVWPAFAHVVETYPIKPEYLHAMLDGQRADLLGQNYDTFETLEKYCYQVAGVVGLCCVSIWGYDGGEATRKLAIDRGTALQLTNIIRDMVEDAQRGRFYIPHEEFARFGLDPHDVARGKASPEFDQLAAFQIERARWYYQKSAALEQFVEPDCRATCGTIMQIYRQLLEKIARAPRQILHGRVRLSSIQKMSIGLGAMYGPRAQTTRYEVGDAPQLPPVKVDLRDKRAVVVGGGLAGIAAALQLAHRGVNVTLVETRKRLGGRATSFTDPDNGQLLDNCQHVLMGCCTNLLDLYRDLGVEQNIAWHSRLYFAGPLGEGADQNPHVHSTLDVMEADDLTAPAHMARSLMGFTMLNVSEKIAISRAMMALLRMGESGRMQWADCSFSDWLSHMHQPQGAVEKFWDNVVISACNELPGRVSARYAMQVFQEGFLSHENAYVVGLPTTPLVQLYDRAADALTRAGGRVMLSTSAERFEHEGNRLTALRLADGSRVTGDLFVSSVPFDRLAKLATSKMRAGDPALERLEEIQVSPIIGIHLWYRRSDGAPVMQLPHVVLAKSALQWLFNKGHDAEQGAQHLHGVISAAYDLVDVPAAQIAEIVDEQVRKHLKGADGAELVHYRVIKEKRATFAPRVGVDALRPGTRCNMSNLYLSGDWCDTGWPATMEGAVRSGYAAAEAALTDMGHGATLRQADLSATWLVRALGAGA